MNKLLIVLVSLMSLVSCGISSKNENSDQKEKGTEQVAPAKKLPAAQEELEEM